MLTLLLHVLLALNKHSAGTDSRIVYLRSLLGLPERHQQTNHLIGRVKLPALLTGAVRKILNQAFVGGSEEIGKFEVLIDQLRRAAIEMVNEIDPSLVGSGRFSLLDVEIDA